MPDEELLERLIIDLRRGTLILAVLCSVNQPKYGYSLMQDLEAQGIIIEANTLYPLLRRLESQGVLLSQWDTSEGRPRKYYQLSAEGQWILKELLAEWRRMAASIEKLAFAENEVEGEKFE